jgi:hypothetical protein
MNLVERAKSVLVDYAAKLEALGSADAIALHLQGRGVKAFCGNTYQCALAEDVIENMIEHGIATYGVTVGGASVGVPLFPEDEATAAHGWVTTELPQAAIDFIHRFDDGAFRALIHPEDEKGLMTADNYATIAAWMNEVD